MPDVLIETALGGIYRTLNDTERWVDKQGRVHQITDMSVRYKRNVVAFLERQAMELAHAYTDGQTLLLLSMPWPGGELAQEEFLNAAEAELPQITEPYGEWLRRTPLLRRLLDDIDAGIGGKDD